MVDARHSGVSRAWIVAVGAGAAGTHGWLKKHLKPRSGAAHPTPLRGLKQFDDQPWVPAAPPPTATVHARLTPLDTQTVDPLPSHIVQRAAEQRLKASYRLASPLAERLG